MVTFPRPHLGQTLLRIPWGRLPQLLSSCELERELVRVRALLADADERAKKAAEDAKQANELLMKKEKAKNNKTKFSQYLHNVQAIITPNLVVETKTANQSSGTVTDVFGKI
jgi:hypothetical protein